MAEAMQNGDFKNIRPKTDLPEKSATSGVNLPSPSTGQGMSSPFPTIPAWTSLLGKASQPTQARWLKLKKEGCSGLRLYHTGDARRPELKERSKGTTD